MVGRYLWRPKPERITENAAGEVIFRGSEGLWLTLVGVAALVGVMAIWFIVSTSASEGVGPNMLQFLIGAALSILMLLGAWFARNQRREVVVDGTGLTVRTRERQVKRHVAWEQLTRIESRFLPSHPTQPAIMLHCADGTTQFIDPLQVHDTSTLLYEAQRRKKNFDDAAQAAKLMERQSAKGADTGGGTKAKR